MITKDFLDQHLLYNSKTATIAQKIAKEELSFKFDFGHNGMNIILEGLAAFSDNDRHYSFSEEYKALPWTKPGHPDFTPYQDGYPSNIIWWGLTYKPKMNYLTAEGWPTGSTCWYCKVENGWREHIGAETPMLALLRTTIVIGVLAKNRRIASKHRPGIKEAIKAYVAEFERESA